MHAYTEQDLVRLFSVSAAAIRGLARAGYLPVRTGPDTTYSFRDLLVVRALAALQAARIPTRTINRALRELKRHAPGVAISQIFFDAGSARIQARDGRKVWDISSGQYALALDRATPEPDSVSMVTHETFMKARNNSAHRHYLRGKELEAQDLAAARAAYESCLAGDCRHMRARINLGRLLHLEGKLREAERVYRAMSEPNAVLFFNLGVLLEDLKREADAIDAYRQAIVHDPGMADAHFNLSLLHERRGQAQAAFRHLLAYHRLRAASSPLT